MLWVTIAMPPQGRPGTNPNEDTNPEYKMHLAAVSAAEKGGSKRKLKLLWNEPQPQTETVKMKEIRAQPEDMQDTIKIEVETATVMQENKNNKYCEPSSKRRRKHTEAETATKSNCNLNSEYPIPNSYPLRALSDSRGPIRPGDS